MIEFRRAPGSLPDGLRVYAIGDVHGCLDRLLRVYEQIEADIALRPAGSALLIHLGDYVDRGADSAGVLRTLLAPPPAGVTQRLNLLGNHEAMMLDVLQNRDETSVAHWMMNGGAQTLASFGLDPWSGADEWAARLQPEPLGLLRRLALVRRIGGYAFVHAGIRPGVPLAKQSAEDLLWIREPFLSSSVPAEAVIVHGHTPAQAPQVRPNRIGIDTGAVMGGVLTCAVLEGGRLGFLSA